MLTMHWRGKAQGLLGLIFATGGCGSDFAGSAAQGDDASADASDTGAPASDATSDADAGNANSEPCQKEGDVRHCNAAGGADGTQTCVAQPDSSLLWGKCFSTACDGTEKPRTDEACIPAGSFTMGGLNGVPDTTPAHPVTIRRRFYVDRYEATVDEFTAWFNAQPRTMPSDGALVFVSGGGDVLRWTTPPKGLAAPGTNYVGAACVLGSGSLDPKMSINCVPWATALAYCMVRGGRLPTEAEWEYVASGQASANDFPWGNSPSPDCAHAVFMQCNGAWPTKRETCSPGNTPSGGVNNLAGNEAEWTLDQAPKVGCAPSCWPSGQNDPLATAVSNVGIVVRGGSFKSDTSDLHTRSRGYLAADAAQTSGTVGFRCVRDER
jgi:formylglycine-generating enzyme required for sulfatase activity